MHREEGPAGAGPQRPPGEGALGEALKTLKTVQEAENMEVLGSSILGAMILGSGLL